jgi:hypothetical protein
MQWAPSSGAVVTVCFTKPSRLELLMLANADDLHNNKSKSKRSHLAYWVALACAVSVLLQHQICRAGPLQLPAPWPVHW